MINIRISPNRRPSINTHAFPDSIIKVSLKIKMILSNEEIVRKKRKNCTFKRLIGFYDTQTRKHSFFSFFLGVFFFTLFLTVKKNSK